MRRHHIGLVVVALVASGVAGITTAVRQSAGRPGGAPAEHGAIERTAQLAKVPLHFVANAGRWDRRVAWVASGHEATAYFVDGGVRWAIAGQDGRGWALEQMLVGARPGAPSASVAAVATVSYFEGDRQHTGIATATELRLDDAWPGIDAVWLGADGQVEATYRVAPAADPTRVRVAWQGADDLSVTPAGRLAVRTPVRTLEEDVPVAWQDIAGRRVPVEVAYDVAADQSYGFRLGAYNPAYELVIDPITLVYASFLGGTADEFGFGVAVDDAGNAYITGSTGSTSMTFPDTPGAFDNELSGDHGDAFVAKVSADGSTLLYATYLGGDDLTFGVAIDVDSSGHAYVTGHARNGFPVTAGAFQTTHAGGFEDAFVTKLDPTGTGLVYSTLLGGSDVDTGQDIDVDAAGNAYVYVGGLSTDFPTTPGAFRTASAGNSDLTVTKLSASGSTVLASTYFGGAGQDSTGGVALDVAGNVYISGSTRSTSATFPETAGAFQTELGGSLDAFVAKLSPDLTSVVYATYLGGPSDDIGEGMSVDAAGNAYLTGEANFGFPTTPGSYGPNHFGQFDVFVTKVNPTGTALVYSTYIGATTNSDRGRALALDTDGSVWVTGLSNFDSNYPTTPDAFQQSHGGSPGRQDGIITKLNPAGTAIVYSTFFGGTGEDGGTSIVLNSEGDAYVYGFTGSSAAEMAETPGAFQPQRTGGGTDAFILKLERTRPTVATQASAGVPLGGAVRDVATLSGAVNPTGSVAFRLYSDAQCSAQVFASTVAVAAGGTAASGWYVPTALGMYYWTAEYSGDGGHKPATSSCGSPNESVVVRPFEPPPCTQTVTGSVMGPITVAAGQSVCMTNARVVRGVTVSPGGALTVLNSKLAGGISADGPAFFSVCGSEVTLAPPASVVLRVANAVVPVRIGDPSAGCSANRIAGHVEVASNAAVIFTSNTVSHNVTITGNGPGAVTMAGNTVLGTLACGGNDPAPSNAGQPNTAGSRSGQCAGL